MSNFGNHTLPIFEDDLETIKEYIKIAFNIIFFHRWLNNNNYTEENSIIKNISYMRIKDDSLEKKIDDTLSKITSFSTKSQKLQISLNFYTNESTHMFFLKRKEGLWEKWTFLVTFSNKSSIDKEYKIRKYLSNVIKELNSDKDFMPDLDLNDFEEANDVGVNYSKLFLFPYEINISQEFEQESILSVMKNMNIKDSFNIKI